jgi:hypothetical protein
VTADEAAAAGDEKVHRIRTSGWSVVPRHGAKAVGMTSRGLA